MYSPFLDEQKCCTLIDIAITYNDIDIHDVAITPVLQLTERISTFDKITYHL